MNGGGIVHVDVVCVGESSIITSPGYLVQCVIVSGEI